MNNLMIDIETLGTHQNSVITQLAAVQFDMKTGEMGENFCENISIESCLCNGLTIDEGSLKFWAHQPQLKFQSLFENGKSLGEVLHQFRVFLQKLGTSELKVWGNSNRFDLGILANAYKAFKQEYPWKYSLERDVRTLVSFAPEIKVKHENNGNNDLKHDALNDCKFQISYCVEICNKLKI